MYGDKYFTKTTIHAWCKTFAHGHESAVDEEGPGRLVAMLFRRPMQRSQQSILSCGLRFDGNLDDTLKNETLMFDV